MVKRFWAVLLSILFLFLPARSVLAITDPLAVPNNNVGIHIFSEKDLEDAAKLVNSRAGDWGYVTVVITEGERDHDRWQQVFDQMRRLHLIPIVRLATKPNGAVWEKPKMEEINNWTGFLNSLNWVIQNRYVIISNEPNHANEWGNELDPEGYAKYLKEFSGKLKQASPDFYVLPAGLDASANNSKETMEEAKYIRAMIKAVPDVFDSIDGWTSHSYPNPDFSGSETSRGKGTISTFNWERLFLKDLGVSKKLPVFITETGWSDKSISQNDIAKKITYAYENVWNDPDVVAVTPFILNYPQPPFGQFSWKDKDGKFNKPYSEVQNLKKTEGKPVQIVSGDILAAFIQPIIPTGSDFVGAVLAKNTGQSIWNDREVVLGSESGSAVFKNVSFNEIEPMRLGLIIFKSAAPENIGIYSQSLFLNTTKGKQVTKSFPVNSVIVKFDSVKIADTLGSGLNFIRSLLKI